MSAEASPPIQMFAIYEKPVDYPDKWVVRRWEIRGLLAVACEATAHDSLNDARVNGVPNGLYPMPRSRYDEQQIVEVWL